MNLDKIKIIYVIGGLVVGGAERQLYNLIKNLDATNYCSIGLTGSYTIKLKAGEFCLFRAAADLFAAFNTAPGYLEIIVVED